MSVPGRSWRMSERILVLAVIVFAVLAVYRLVNKESAPAPAASPVAQPPAASAPQPEQAVGPPPGPAAAELLARIRSCSGKDLEGIVDKVTGAEALGLFKELSVTDRQTVFSALPAPILGRKAHALLGIPESSFRRAGNHGILASSLVEAAMGAAAASADPQVRTLCFTTAVDAQGVPQAPRGLFRPDERKIHACLDGGSEPTGEPGVLVRWTGKDSGALVYLHYLPLALNRRWNHVHFEVADTWPAGTYQVDFYRIGESVALLAEGSYTVGNRD